MTERTTYKDAGVDIDAGIEAVRQMKKHVKSTFSPNVLTGLGSFSGLYQFDKDKYKEPVLVSSCDGVGTKLKLAYWTGKHDTVGQDLVNHCVNDILVCGAKPLFFLDYFGTSKLNPEDAGNLLKGFAKACRENNCSLIGGETAELPGLYRAGEYDLAGMIVGVVEKKEVLDVRKVKAGDVLIGLASTGLHTNGFSLAIKILFEKKKFHIHERLDELDAPLAEVLMRVHKSYLHEVAPLLDKKLIKGMAHITGGGFYDNIPRVLPKGLGAEIDKSSWTPLPIFKLIQEHGNVDDEEMYRVFNMGIGMVLIVDKKDVDSVMKATKESVVIGKVSDKTGVRVLF